VYHYNVPSSRHHFLVSYIIDFPSGMLLDAARCRIPPIAFEFVLFVLGVAKFYEAVKAGWGQESVILRFLADGVWAFILPFGSLASPLSSLPS
jgi:hypothetical protein